MDKFEIGEVAIYVRPGSPSYGNEVMIIGPLAMRGGGFDYVNKEKMNRCFGYKIEFGDGDKGPNGKGFMAKPEWLRKKPKRQDAREWFNQNIKLNKVREWAGQ